MFRLRDLSRICKHWPNQACTRSVAGQTTHLARRAYKQRFFSNESDGNGGNETPVEPTIAEETENKESSDLLSSKSKMSKKLARFIERVYTEKDPEPDENGADDFFQVSDVWNPDAPYDKKLIPRPYIPEKVREKMYQLHKEDPQYWNVHQLASRFQIDYHRVFGILALKEREKRNPPAPAESPEEQEEMVKLRNSVEKASIWKFRAEEYQHEPFPFVEGTAPALFKAISDSDQDREIDMFIERFTRKETQRVQNRRRHEGIEEEPSVITQAPKNKAGVVRQTHRWSYAIKDLSRKPKDPQYVCIRTQDNVYREATHQELEQRSWHRQDLLRTGRLHVER